MNVSNNPTFSLDQNPAISKGTPVKENLLVRVERNEGLKAIAKMERLISLDFGSDNVGNADKLADMKKLTFLKLSDCHYLDIDSIQLLERKPNLTLLI